LRVSTTLCKFEVLLVPREMWFDDFLGIVRGCVEVYIRMQKEALQR
jgi:hypothetical protein